MERSSKLSFQSKGRQISRWWRHSMHP